MVRPTMTLQDDAWKRSVLAEMYAEDGQAMSDADALHCASLYVNNVRGLISDSLTLVGEWDYNPIKGTMTGPASVEALQAVMAAHVSAADMVADYLARNA